jgi:hypothetical protein
MGDISSLSRDIDNNSFFEIDGFRSSEDLKFNIQKMSKYFIFIPNLLSIVRIGLVYPILNNILMSNFLISLVYFLIASLTDALDGFLARR